MGRTSDDRFARGARDEQPVDDVRDKVILALVAIILGGGGAAGYMNINPPRPDPWTGTMDRERMAEEQREDAERIAEIYRHMNLKHEAFDRHIVESAEGYRRIRATEGECQKNSARISRSEERLDDALATIKELDQRLDRLERTQ